MVVVLTFDSVIPVCVRISGLPDGIDDAEQVRRLVEELVQLLLPALLLLTFIPLQSLSIIVFMSNAILMVIYFEIEIQYGAMNCKLILNPDRALEAIAVVK
ncbi:hypothetical protein RHMOL_Rhmol12G0203200 [Rhododendron molle]|uniref:Uncharacterized protein n=1 Tax=Rhododendron molle TaxID=49168 RepID=A0ACC0LKJ0_RHOML|nr:hypothetical protein RHMOL_Rhmol12G0203200 [Rhododendron molle]